MFISSSWRVMLSSTSLRWKVFALKQLHELVVAQIKYSFIPKEEMKMSWNKLNLINLIEWSDKSQWGEHNFFSTHSIPQINYNSIPCLIECYCWILNTKKKREQHRVREKFIKFPVKHLSWHHLSVRHDIALFFILDIRFHLALSV